MLSIFFYNEVISVKYLPTFQPLICIKKIWLIISMEISQIQNKIKLHKLYNDKLNSICLKKRIYSKW